MNAESAVFPDPAAPYPSVLAYAHTHDLAMVGARVNPDRTWSSLWACSQCPDVFIGGHIGPIPPGYCRCGWVQKKWPARKCEECKRPMRTTPAKNGDPS